MFDPDYSVHPGEILRDELEARGIEPDAEMQAVLEGGVLSDELAERLETVTGLRARVWKNLMRYCYEWALKRLHDLWGVEEERGEFERLATLIEAYEEAHYPLDAPTLQDIINYWEDQRPEQVTDLRAVAEKLQALYTDEEAVEWVCEEQELLGDETAVDLILDGRVGEVLALLDRIEAGAYL